MRCFRILTLTRTYGDEKAQTFFGDNTPNPRFKGDGRRHFEIYLTNFSFGHLAGLHTYGIYVRVCHVEYKKV